MCAGPNSHGRPFLGLVSGLRGGAHHPRRHWREGRARCAPPIGAHRRYCQPLRSGAAGGLPQGSAGSRPALLGTAGLVSIPREINPDAADRALETISALHRAHTKPSLSV